MDGHPTAEEAGQLPGCAVRALSLSLSLPSTLGGQIRQSIVQHPNN